MIRVATGDRIRSTPRDDRGGEIRRGVEQGPIPAHLITQPAQPKAVTDEERIRRSLVAAGASGGGRTAGELARNLELPVQTVRELLKKIEPKRRVLDEACLERRGALLEYYL